jgi:hypothetical protein
MMWFLNRTAARQVADCKDEEFEPCILQGIIGLSISEPAPSKNDSVHPKLPSP